MTRIWLLTLLSLMLSAGGAFGESLTLQEALSRASTANRALRVISFDEKIAAENIGISRSGYLPKVDFQGGYTVQQAPQAISMPQGEFQTQQADFAYFTVSFYQTLYDFGRTSARTTRANAVHQAVRSDYQGQQQEVFLRTVSAYFRILQGQKLLEAAEQEARQMADHLRQAKIFYEQGVVTRNDLLQAEVRLASSMQRRLDVANRLENAWLILNDLLGEPPDYRRDLVDSSVSNQILVILPPVAV